MVQARYEKTGLQGAAMMCFVAGIGFMTQGASLENKIFGVVMILVGIGAMLYKYKREEDRGVIQ